MQVVEKEKAILFCVPRTFHFIGLSKAVLCIIDGKKKYFSFFTSIVNLFFLFYLICRLEAISVYFLLYLMFWVVVIWMVMPFNVSVLFCTYSLTL